MAPGDDARPSPTSSFSHAQLATLHDVICVTSALSILGCLYILVHHFRLRRRGAPSVMQTMVAILSLLDVSFSAPKVLGIAGPDGSFECSVQGFVLGFTGVMSVIWNSCLAHSIYRKIVRRESEEKLQRRLRLYIAVTIAPALAASAVQWALGLFGDAIFYCWIRDKRLHILCLYTWVVAAMLYISVVLVSTQTHISRRAEIQGNLEAFESSSAITRQLRLYIIVFVVNWSPGVIFRVIGGPLGLDTFPMAVFMQITLCSLGFVTSIIYGGLLSRPLRLFQARWSSSNDYQAITHATAHATGRGGHVNGLRQPLRIFVSTFNMGEGAISEEQLQKWIPRGHDLYVIGVQECLQLNELRQQIRHHIEGQANLRTHASRSRFVRYAQFCREIGSTTTTLGYHGFIAITVFVKQRDVMSGAFFMAPKAQQAVNCGKSLLFGQRASNKGAVGFGFRYFDTSFAFVTCHLTSDLKGKSHVEKRSRDASDVIKSLHLNVDDLGFEFPLMHHHTFVLGDLNYRLRQQEATPNQILELVANARLTKAAACAADAAASGLTVRSVRMRSKAKHRPSSSWLLSSFGSRDSQPGGSTALGGDTSADAEVVAIETPTLGGIETPTCEETFSIMEDVKHAPTTNAWEDVLAHDELLHLMSESKVFYGFEEPKIAFDPTFRRVRDRSIPSSRSRQLSAEELVEYYTTAIDGRGQRVPSYTDRILHFSQPDMRLNLECARYQSCEDVTCSDHKPVSAVFRTAVNRDYRPLVSRAELESRPRLQDVPGVVECALRIECSSLTWNQHVHPVLDSIHLSHLRVTLMFPLPSEDAFSEQRTLHEFAAHLRNGVFASASASDPESMANTASVPYHEFRSQGVRHVTLARLMGAMHVALKIHTDAALGAARCVGQGAIGLPKSVLAGAGERMPFHMPLSRGGELRGTLEGTVSLAVSQAMATISTTDTELATTATAC